MNIRAAVIATIQAVAKEQSRTLAPLTDDLLLIESGLNSLCLAVVVAKLEDELGIDPFSDASAESFPDTIGDFVGSYENARVQ